MLNGLDDKQVNLSLLFPAVTPFTRYINEYEWIVKYI